MCVHAYACVTRARTCNAYPAQTVVTVVIVVTCMHNSLFPKDLMQ
jgi:hypothetical protein